MNKKGDLFDELMIMSAKAQRDLYSKLDREQSAIKAHFEAARRQLSAAIEAAKRDDHHEALRLLDDMHKGLHKANLPCDWAEFYIAQAICYRRLGDMASVNAAWKNALDVEPDSEKLKDMAVKLGLIQH